MSRIDDQLELDRIKQEIPLGEYAASRGFEVDRRESSRSYLVMRRGDDKIVITRGQQKNYWVYFDPHSDQSGTIVDFIQKTLGERLSIGRIRKELRPWLESDRQRISPPVHTPQSAPRCDRQAVAAQFARGREAATSLYLNGRGLRPETLCHERFRGTWREEPDGRIMFAHHDREGLSGFERKGPGFTGFATGGRRSLWRSGERPDDTRLVLAESAIDAMSYHQLNPDSLTRYASTGGALSPYQRELLARAIKEMPARSTVVLAFDRDPAGDKMARLVETLAQGASFLRHLPPTGKDWNDFLKLKERDYIRWLGLPDRSASLGR